MRSTDKELNLEAGGVRLKITYRHLGNDGGVAIYVYGEAGERAVQLLRFDCFAQAPHYHFDPGGRDERIMLDRAATPDPLGWALEQLKTRLGEMIKRSGYEQVAAAVDQQAVAAALSQAEEAIRDLSARQGQ